MNSSDKEIVDQVYDTITSQWTDNMIDNLSFRLGVFLQEKTMPPWEED